jgi:hypothetical protein
LKSVMSSEKGEKITIIPDPEDKQYNYTLRFDENWEGGWSGKAWFNASAVCNSITGMYEINYPWKSISVEGGMTSLPCHSSNGEGLMQTILNYAHFFCIHKGTQGTPDTLIMHTFLNVRTPQGIVTPPVHLPCIDKVPYYSVWYSLED